MTTCLPSRRLRDRGQLGCTTETDASALETMPGCSSEVDFLHRIGEHVAQGDTFDEALSSTIDFAVWLVRCDECVAYVREGIELVPWVWKYTGDRSVEQSRLALDHAYARALAEHQQPIAISRGADKTCQIKHFSAWSTNPGEAFIVVPLLARSGLVGALDFKHRQPHPYSRREFKLISSVGHLLGAYIRIWHLESENADLLLQLETRKLVERAQSRQKHRPMKSPRHHFE